MADDKPKQRAQNLTAIEGINRQNIKDQKPQIDLPDHAEVVQHV